MKIPWLMFIVPCLGAQPVTQTIPVEECQDNKFSFNWGYNRAFYSRSDIHFSGPDYDFVLYDVSASDRPTPFSAGEYFSPVSFTIPQYNMRLAYHFKKRWAISFGMDHMKYVVEKGQRVRISGVISPEASEVYKGSYLNDEITVDPDFLVFEHTDGLNLVTLEIEHYIPLLRIAKDKVKVRIKSAIGGIWMVTRTDVKVMGNGMNNDFHIAGFTMSGVVGPRIDFFNRFFISADAKAGYVTLPWVLIKNSEPMLANHDFSFFQYYLTAGVYFRLWQMRR